MMNPELLRQLAIDCMARGQANAAIDYLTQILGEHSDSAEAHALLSLALVRKKRIYAARIEARLALELEPEAFFPHIAVASVEMAAGNFCNAEKHLQIAISFFPNAAYPREKLARLYLLWDKTQAAMEQIVIACELDPDDLDCLVTKARLLHSQGDNKNAELIAREALEVNPEHLDSLVLLGEILLATGDIAAAKESALWAVQLDPNDESALHLLASIKARESLLLGIWWRFQTFVSSGSSTRAIVLLIGMFLLYRISTIVLNENNLSAWTFFVSCLWIAFCVYTWLAPNMFRRMLANEQKKVELKSNF